MFAGKLPEWPVKRPFPGAANLSLKVPKEFLDFLHRALQVNDRRRFAVAGYMLEACLRLVPKVEHFLARARRRRI